jgi:hypothetical protein
MAVAACRRGPSVFRPRLEVLERREVPSYLIKWLANDPIHTVDLAGRGQAIGTDGFTSYLWLRNMSYSKPETIATAMNDKNAVVGRYYGCVDDTGYGCGFAWEPVTGWSEGLRIDDANGVSNDGTAVGQYQGQASKVLFDYPYVALQTDLPYTGSNTAISNTGVIVGYRNVGSCTQATVSWDDGQHTSLLGVPYQCSKAIAVSGNGQWIAGVGDAGEAWIYHDGQTTQLGHAGVAAVNDLGDAVGQDDLAWIYHASTGEGGEIMVGGGFIADAPTAINDKGMITAELYGSSGHFAALLIPYGAAPGSGPGWEILAAMAQAAKKDAGL